MQRLLRILFVVLIAKPITLLLLGVNIRHRQRLDWQQPAIIVANHNSHLDTLVLLSLVPLRYVHLVHPAAAADYFLCNPVRAWFSRQCLGIVGVQRKQSGQHPLAECEQVLTQGHTLILFPEGTRGEPEKLQAIKSGVAHLAKAFPHLPVVPIFMHGLGRALPKGEWLLVPFFCDAFVGQAIYWQDNKASFLSSIEQSFIALKAELPASWMQHE